MISAVQGSKDMRPLDIRDGDEYVSVAASKTDVALGPAGGAIGDYLGSVDIQPASTSPGAVTIKDGTVTVYTYPGGVGAVGFTYPFRAGFPGGVSVNGGWKVTTGANVSIVCRGKFA